VRLHFCGVRGSTPAPGHAFERYGGNTSCIAVAHDDADTPTLVLDAGTGLARVAPLLGGTPFRGTILLTHLHWDHTHGLPFFPDADREDARATLYLPDQGDGQSAASVLARCMSPPHFPIGPTQLRGDWRYELLAPGPIEAEGFTVTAIEIPHKGGCTYGYRVSDGHSTIAYAPDHCPTVLGPGDDGLGARHPAALALASDVDALVHDALLLPDELEAEASFGHAAADYAVGLGREAGARRVVLFHHKPSRTDDALDELASRLGRDGQVTVAAESLVLSL
jgi:phosphoribosyl 1,2-cyclic phosphodiesterase